MTNETNETTALAMHDGMAGGEMAASCMERFEGGVLRLRAQFLEGIQKAIPWGEAEIRKTLDSFDAHLKVFQHEFLASLPRFSRAEEVAGSMEVPSSSSALPTVLGGLGAGGATAGAMLLPLVTVKSWILGTTTTSAAGWLAGALGVSAGMAAGVVGGLVAGVAGWGIWHGLQAAREREQEEMLMRKFDGTLRPQLMEWGRAAVAAAFRGT